MNRPTVIAVLGLWLGGCGEPEVPPLLGTLEWDRVGVAAERSEPILEVLVAEGDLVAAGAPILHLDRRRTEAELAEAGALRAQAQAALALLRHGARAETVDASRAELSGAEADELNARQNLLRSRQLHQDGVITRAELDRAEASARGSEARRRAARARLQELLHGSRPEDLDQAAAALAAAEAQLRALQLRLERLQVRAPRAGRVDALPYKLGDQPPAGASLVSLLVGEAPYARVYVPARQRPAVAPGLACELRIEGYPQAYRGQVRSLRAEPAFTPYYALTGDDASRLAYRAEIVLDGDTSRLPAGLPVQAFCAADDH